MGWWLRKEREKDLDRELRSDLELEAAEQQERGLSADEARYAAQRALGNGGLIREDTRATWRWMSADRIGQDLRYAARQMKKTPGFATLRSKSLTY